MLLGQHSGWSHRCQPWLNLVLQSAYDIAIGFHHRLEADFGDISGIILLARADRCIEHIGAFEEFRLSCAWHKTSHRHAGILWFLAQSKGKRIHERLGSVVNRLVRSRHKASDRSRDENAAFATFAHLVPHFVNEIQCARHVSVDYVPRLFEILIEKRVPETMSGVGEQRLYGPAVDRENDLIYALRCRQITLDRIN